MGDMLASTPRPGPRAIAADSTAHLYSLHGQGIKLTAASAFLLDAVNHLLGDFAVPSLPAGASVVEGAIRLYDANEVLRRLPASAARVSPPGELTEVYQQDELYWLIDDRWGLCEINLLRGQWRTWVLPQPAVEPQRCLEMAVLWPLAQLLRGKGLVLVPAASRRSSVCPVGAVSMTTNRSSPWATVSAKARKTAISSVHGERRSSSSLARPSASRSRPFASSTRRR